MDTGSIWARSAAQRPAPQNPQHVGVAPLLTDHLIEEFAAHQPPVGRQPTQHIGGHPRPNPNRAAAAAVVNGPRVRAVAARVARPAGRVTGSVKLTGTPIGTAIPIPSRNRPMSSIAAHQVCPAKDTVTARLAARSPSSQPPTSAPPERAATSSAVSGPSSRSRSATPSASRAARSGDRCWS
ncbi:hypothetical protein C1Y40_04116 [Mycobacterium talmoniae]|uniref:Uncharacterized protein n=1 Tax=Mycobacterium talmoniae TaxID=1858794 RepID=A0A2S8BGH8_9MYCO|nr:hypothetical protein C1Y40_04116 [Mycobacterium talmoniae]